MAETTLPITNPNPTPNLPLPPPPKLPMKTSTNTWISILSYILSLPLLCYGIWLLVTKDYYCQDHLHMSHLREIVGVGFIVVFMISCFVTYYGARVVLPGALVMSGSLLVMLVFGMLLIGSYSMESRKLPASPLWMKSQVEDDEIWINVKSCIYQSRTCQYLAFDSVGLSADDFNNTKRSRIEFGCCRPPSVCQMEYVNATYWRRSKKIETFANSEPPTIALNSTTKSKINPNMYRDCQAYSNENTRLCYDCESCKQGFTSTVHRKWKVHGVFMIVMSVMLLLVHVPQFILAMMQSKKS